jgi:hypothetical protein
MSQRNQRSATKLEAAVLHWLILQAASKAPNFLSRRLEEEWSADLDARRSAFSRVRFAFGCWWAVIVISRDSRELQVPAAGPVAAVGAPLKFQNRNLRYMTLGPATLFLILGLHAALIWGLTTVRPQSVRSSPPVAIAATPN